METLRKGNFPGKYRKPDVENYVENVENLWKYWKPGVKARAEKRNENVSMEKENNFYKYRKKKGICKIPTILQERRRPGGDTAAQ